MKYPIAIEWGDENTAVGIHIPDIPDAVTAGDTIEEAYAAAIEIAHIRLEELAESGEAIPRPSTLDDLRKKSEYEGYGWGLLEIDVTPYLGKTEKVNVTIPGTIVRKIDRYVERHSVKSRSAFLTDAAIEKLERMQA